MAAVPWTSPPREELSGHEADDKREYAALLENVDDDEEAKDSSLLPSTTSTTHRPTRASRGRLWFWALLVILAALVAWHPVRHACRSWRHMAGYGGKGGAASTTYGDLYLLGVGKGDITGPVVEINMMGYANPQQLGTGLRQRLYSRAFIVGDTANPHDRFVYLVLDTQSGDTAVRYGIISGLKALGPEYSVYGHQNIAVTGTHSHSGPAGWLNYLLPQITSKGFDQQGYRAIIDGAILSIQRAHESLQPGYLSVGSTKVNGAGINRSLFAYMANPAEERARHNASANDDGSVDKELSLLKFQRASDGKNIGVLTWFPTHGTSMLGNNTLISGDNKGVAAYLFEQSVKGDDSAADGFVAGFSQANVGDVTPNVLGAWCEDGSGERCSYQNSTCPDGTAQSCHGRGPLFRVEDEGASSCFEIGKRQFEPARALYDKLTRDPSPVRGASVKSFHTFHNMSGYTFVLPNGTEVRTCPAALGYSFAAGTSDWPGTFNFTQHDSDPSNTSPVWRAVSHLMKEPSPEQRACHGEKPILMDVGEMHRPYAWTPNVVDVQVFRVGQLLIVVSPGEATTMAGRRWKAAVRDAAASVFASASVPSRASARPPVVVLGGPANSYAHYIATEEEYAVQRYEGASTLYGPHTLAAYINVTLRWLPYLAEGAATPPRPEAGSFPPDNSNRSLSFIPGVVRDGTPLFKGFGDIVDDVHLMYYRGESAVARFVGANPRNDLRLERTYAAVERLVVPAPGIDAGDAPATWTTARDDGDWSLVFRWVRVSEVLGTSEVEITWEIELDAEPGMYRLRYFGDSKALGGEITPFEGASRPFSIV